MKVSTFGRLYTFLIACLSSSATYYGGCYDFYYCCCHYCHCYYLFSIQYASAPCDILQVSCYLFSLLLAVLESQQKLFGVQAKQFIPEHIPNLTLSHLVLQQCYQIYHLHILEEETEAQNAFIICLCFKANKNGIMGILAQHHTTAYSSN